MRNDMEKETLTDNLEKLLMAIHRQVVQIRDAEEKIPKVEMDKTLSNIRALYEQFTVLNYLNSFGPERAAMPPAPEVKPAPEEVKDSPFIPIVEKHTEPEPVQPVAQAPVQPEIKQEPYMPPPVQPVPEKQPEPVQPVAQIPVQAVIKQEVYTPAQTQPVVPPSVQPVIPVQPQFTEPVKPVPQAPASEQKYQPKPITPTPEKPAQAENHEPVRLADKLRLQKVDDLHKAVSLSDKFLYMNELFEGENNAYKEALDMLNRLNASAEAEHYLDALAARYGWGEHAKTEKKFRELVSRKFN